MDIKEYGSRSIRAEEEVQEEAEEKEVDKEEFVQGGTFMMGSDDEEPSCPIHGVTVSDFWIMKTTITQRDCNELMGDSLSEFIGPENPVESVNWYDAVAYANALSLKDCLVPAYTIQGDKVSCNFKTAGWRLPTEAEWEYAARGGSKSRGYKYAGSDDIDAVAWYRENSEGQPHEVGTKDPNELGLYDMSGNVSEWCWDWYDVFIAQKQVNPHGPWSGSTRVIRGGSWDGDASECTVAYRSGNNPDFRYYDVGFRLIRPQF
jgi:formylglycine-generating enzyme